ncbi:MAG: MFS transporter [Tissierellia bacterium]|nr:MFS transporter [Tissierellia bacterium]
MSRELVNKKESLWTKDFILLLASNLLLFIGFYMLLTTLPAYIFAKGGSASDVGMITAVLIISAIFIRPFSGIALESVDKKLFLAVGVAICLISIGSFNWATAVFTIMFIRFIHGFGWGISTTTYGTIASDLVPISRRGEGMGYFSSAGTIAMSLGPPLGIMLMNDKGFPTLFMGATVSTLLALIFIYFIRVPKVEKSQPTEEMGKITSRLMEKSALFPSFLALLLGFTYGGITSFITLFGQEVGIENVGWFFTVNAVFILITRSIAGRIFDERGHFWVVVPGAILSFLGVLILSYVKSSGMLILSAITYGIGFGTVQPSLLAWSINSAKPARRGAANATFFSAFDIGIGAGSIILSHIGESMSYSTMYRISSIPMIGLLVIYLLFVRNRKEDV